MLPLRVVIYMHGYLRFWSPALTYDILRYGLTLCEPECGVNTYQRYVTTTHQE